MITTTLLGRLGADPETKAVKDTTVTTIRVAADTFAKGEKRTVWVRASVFGKRGEALAAHTKKGDQIVISGQLYVDEYESKGERRYSIEIAHADFSFVSNGGGANNANNADKETPF